MIRAAVIGHPIKHSRSPLIHGFWLAEHRIDGAYDAIDVAPDNLAAFLDEVRGGRFAGCNATLPHKEAIAATLDEVMPEAAALGSINTVWRDGSRLIGTSTDGAGYLAHLRAEAPDWDAAAARVVMFGAGGAARALADALLRAGVRTIAVVNRSRARAIDLAEHMNRVHGLQGAVTAHGMVGHADVLSGCTLLINTTALGMEGQPALPVALDRVGSGCLVSDIVYAPLETPLLRAARARDLPTLDGLGMLLHQAVPGFERWFGVRPSVSPRLRDFIVADLNEPGAGVRALNAMGC